MVGHLVIGRFAAERPRPERAQREPLRSRCPKLDGGGGLIMAAVFERLEPPFERIVNRSVKDSRS
jgi:hypothetical protein